MELVLLVYLLDVLDTLKTICIFSVIFLPLCVFFYHLATSDLMDDLSDVVKRVVVKKWIILWLVLLTVSMVIPTRNTMLLMTGVYYGQQVFKEVKDSPITQKTVKLLELELEKQLNEAISEDKNNK